MSKALLLYYSSYGPAETQPREIARKVGFRFDRGFATDGAGHMPRTAPASRSARAAASSGSRARPAGGLAIALLCLPPLIATTILAAQYLDDWLAGLVLGSVIFVSLVPLLAPLIAASSRSGAARPGRYPRHLD
ncbi:hypothetical protein CLG96_12240 [Sphingomonas oleivorans]|uniref:Uncharacterized protein n=1 Tax=Sphingomonas oleivorans TaxID=1735121 RepID=A0A2T5FVX5_9SPHN|nr:hypothetical protein [Sphingomonas oleivorans]PTQ09922.1 hypothetical protein CLG96_12240 [Sphingomonas oleivorans]